jgi:hypothetical protein
MMYPSGRDFSAFCLDGEEEQNRWLTRAAQHAIAFFAATSAATLSATYRTATVREPFLPTLNILIEVCEPQQKAVSLFRQPGPFTRRTDPHYRRADCVRAQSTACARMLGSGLRYRLTARHLILKASIHSLLLF